MEYIASYFIFGFMFAVLRDVVNYVVKHKHPKFWDVLFTFFFPLYSIGLTRKRFVDEMTHNKEPAWRYWVIVSPFWPVLLFWSVLWTPVFFVKTFLIITDPDIR